MTKIAAVFPNQRAGYWGTNAGAADIDVRAIRNGDVGTTGHVRWDDLPLRGFKVREFERALVRAGDIVLTTSGNCGNVAFISSDPAEATAATNFVRVLRVDANIADPRYAFHFLRTARFHRAIAPFIRGATIKNLSVAAAFDVVEMPTPSLDDQRRIAAILDHADALRVQRRQVLTHLDAVTHSIFHSTFDEDPGERYELGEVADFVGGSSLPEGEAFNAQAHGTLLMKVSDMNTPGNDEQIVVTALWSGGQTARSATVTAGAVILPKRGASIATNKKRLSTRRTALDPNLMGVQPNPQILTSRYLYEWFKSFDLATITSGSTVPQLNKQDLDPLLIPVPPLAHQKAFARRVEAVNTQRSRALRGLAGDNDLFASLQSRAFRGEL